MITQRSRKHEIVSDGRTVWVNAFDGTRIGRYRRGMMDVHADTAGQTIGLHCLDCAHGERPGGTAIGWNDFVVSMLENHGIAIPDKFRIGDARS